MGLLADEKSMTHGNFCRPSRYTYKGHAASSKHEPERVPTVRRFEHNMHPRRLLAVCRILTTASAMSIMVVISAQDSRPGQASPPSQPPRSPSQPTRDNPAQSAAAPAPTGRITGRVVAADTGRPIRRARVLVTAGQIGARGALTDDDGVFELTDLPAGRYTLTASKTVFVALSYGQRRPFQAGTPLQLADGQQMKGLDFRLPRGSVIGGRVSDETGEPMPGVSVRVMRYQYAQGERQLTPAGTAQTDDRGAFRVWGLNPGDYYVMAVVQNFDFGVRAAAAQFFGGGGGGPGFGGRGGGGGGRGGRGGPPGLLPDAASGDDET